MKKGCLFLLVFPFFMSNLWAKHHTVDLTVGYGLWTSPDNGAVNAAIASEPI